MMRLYHGSDQEISEIDLTRGLPDKDFGQGFYLTHLRHRTSCQPAQESRSNQPLK